MFTALPLLVFPVVFYNLFAVTQILGGPERALAVNQILTSQFISVPMPAGGSHWTVSWGDLFIFFGLLVLFFELVRATNTNKVAIINHSLSMILFIICLVEFLLVPGFATSTFALITTMTLLDVLAGFIVTIVTARKDFDFAG
jgi:hypothetical protein